MQSTSHGLYKKRFNPYSATLIIMFLALLLTSLSSASFAFANEDFSASTAHKELNVCGCSSFTQQILVQNTGSVASLYIIRPYGKTSSWQKLPSENFILIPGQRAKITSIITSECNSSFGSFPLITRIATETGVIKDINQVLNVIDCYNYSISIANSDGSALFQKDKEMVCGQTKSYSLRIDNLGIADQEYELAIQSDFANLSLYSVMIPKNSTALLNLAVSPFCNETRLHKVSVISVRKPATAATEPIPTISQASRTASFDLKVYSKEDAYMPRLSGPSKLVSHYTNKSVSFVLTNTGRFNASYYVIISGDIVNLDEKELFLMPDKSTSIQARLVPSNLPEGKYNFSIMIIGDGFKHENNIFVLLRKDVISKMSETYYKKVQPKMRVIVIAALLALFLGMLVILIIYFRTKVREKIFRRVYGYEEGKAIKSIVSKDKKTGRLAASADFKFITKQAPTEIVVGDDRFDITKMVLKTNKNVPFARIRLYLKEVDKQDFKEFDQHINAASNALLRELPDKKYSGFSITKKGLNTDDVHSVKIFFRIRKSWLAANSLNKNKVSLHYTGRSVQEFYAKHLGSDHEWAYYESTINNFGSFVIGSSKKTSRPSDDEVFTTLAKRRNWTKTLLIILIIMILIIGIGVLMMKYKPEKYEKTTDGEAGEVEIFNNASAGPAKNLLPIAGNEIEETIDFAKKNKLDNTIYYQIWDQNTNKQINLSNYFKIPEAEAAEARTIRFGISAPANITAVLSDDVLLLLPPKDWYGIDYIYVAASDGSKYFEEADVTLIVQRFEPTTWNILKRKLAGFWDSIKRNVAAIVFFILFIIVLVIIINAIRNSVMAWKKEEARAAILAIKQKKKKKRKK